MGRSHLPVRLHHCVVRQIMEFTVRMQVDGATADPLKTQSAFLHDLSGAEILRNMPCFHPMKPDCVEQNTENRGKSFRHDSQPPAVAGETVADFTAGIPLRDRYNPDVPNGQPLHFIRNAPMITVRFAGMRCLFRQQLPGDGKLPVRRGDIPRNLRVVCPF